MCIRDRYYFLKNLSKQYIISSITLLAIWEVLFLKILVINAGSSSLKYQLIDMDDESVIAKGICERIGKMCIRDRLPLHENRCR